MAPVPLDGYRNALPTPSDATPADVDTSDALLADALQSFRAEAIANEVSAPRRRQSLSKVLDDKVPLVPQAPLMSEAAAAAAAAAPKWEKLQGSFRRRRWSSDALNLLKDSSLANSKDAIDEFMTSKHDSPVKVHDSSGTVLGNLNPTPREQVGGAASKRSASSSATPREQADGAGNKLSATFPRVKPSRQRRSSCDSISIDTSSFVMRRVSLFGTMGPIPSPDSPRRFPKQEDDQFPPLHTTERSFSRQQQATAREEASRENPREKSRVSVAEEQLKKYSAANGPWRPSNCGAGAAL